MPETLISWHILSPHPKANLKKLRVISGWLEFCSWCLLFKQYLHSYFRETLTTLCIYPCSSPWEIWPPFYFPCTPCTEQGLKQSKAQHWDVQFQHSSQSGPRAVLSPHTIPSLVLCVWQCLPLVLLETEVTILLSRLLVLCRRAAATGKLRSSPGLPRCPGILSILQGQSCRSGSQVCQGKSHLCYQSGGVSPRGSAHNPGIPLPQFYPRKGWEDPTHEF